MTREELQICARVSEELDNQIADIISELCPEQLRLTTFIPQWVRDGEWHFLIHFDREGYEWGIEMLLNETELLNLKETLQKELEMQDVI